MVFGYYHPLPFNLPKSNGQPELEHRILSAADRLLRHRNVALACSRN